MERGYIRPVKGLSEAQQREALRGVDPIYTDLALAIEHLCDGDMLALGGPLHILTGSATGIIDLVDEIRERGCDVIDKTSGKTTFEADNRYAMLAEALEAAKRVRRFGDVTQAAKNGAEARWKEHTKDRLPKAKARELWKSREILTNQMALDLMPGWTDRMARFAFGPSGRKPGPK